MCSLLLRSLSRSLSLSDRQAGSVNNKRERVAERAALSKCLLTKFLCYPHQSERGGGIEMLALGTRGVWAGRMSGQSADCSKLWTADGATNSGGHFIRFDFSICQQKTTKIKHVQTSKFVTHKINKCFFFYEFKILTCFYCRVHVAAIKAQGKLCASLSTLSLCRLSAQSSFI